MKKKFIFIVMLLAACSFAANAQLTTGNPSAKVIRTGNRPQTGDFGLYVGYGSDAIASLVSGMGYTLPIINLKYFLSTDLELRIGIDSEVGSDWAKGKLQGATERSGSSESESYFGLAPGLAYHFSKHNIIDVYAGAELPLGVFSNGQSVFDKGAGTSAKTTRTGFTVGLEPFVGLQVFIANLPVALGVEYGFSGYTVLGDKYKNVAESGGVKQTYYTTIADTSTLYDKLSTGHFGINHDVRITLSYYFK